jgi:hypothetical protein
VLLAAVQLLVLWALDGQGARTDVRLVPRAPPESEGPDSTVPFVLAYPAPPVPPDAAPSGAFPLGAAPSDAAPGDAGTLGAGPSGPAAVLAPAPPGPPVAGPGVGLTLPGALGPVTATAPGGTPSVAPPAAGAPPLGAPAPVPAAEPGPVSPAAPAAPRPLTIRLDRPAGPPGSRLGVTGAGCEPGAPVVLAAGSTRLGSAIAAGDGTFSAGVLLPFLPVGRVGVSATCGDRAGGAPFDVLVSRRIDVGTSAFFVLLFFLLVAFAMRKHVL